MKENILVSFSGGKTSAYMSWMLKQQWGNDCNLLFIFANTGKEKEQTLQFAKLCDAYFGLNLVWVEADVRPKGEGTKHRIVDFESASRSGEPFEAMIQKFGIPNQSYSHCTRELKIAPIHSFAKEYFDGEYKTAIGIRADEFDRMTQEKGRIYPLVKANIRKQDVNDFWGKMPFTLEIEPHQGNCDACWKKSDRKLMQLAKESPEIFDWWDRMEKKYGAFVNEGQVTRPTDKPITFFRKHKSAASIVREAQSQGIILSLFDDISNGCSDSCEI